MVEFLTTLSLSQKPFVEPLIDTSIILEAVDGTKMPCYGKRKIIIQIGRKQYHQEVFITNTSEIILGMDFIHKYKMEFRWGPFGDYFI